MQSYNELIYEGLPGGNPKEKFENLEIMKRILLMVAYPKRGVDNLNTLQDIADTIQIIFRLEDLE